MESSNPVQAAREKLMESLTSCAQRKQVATTRQAALHAMIRRHKPQATHPLKHGRQEILAQKKALDRANRQFQDGQRTVLARVVELSKVELRVITEKVQQKLPLEVREMIFEMCWDDDSLFWAQEILRFSQILDSNGDRYLTYRQLEWVDEVFEGPPRHPDEPEPCMREMPHVCQLSTDNYEVLFANEFMDGYGLQRLHRGTSDMRSIIRCLGKYLTSPQVVGHAVAQEFLLAFYRTELRCNFYVELPHLEHFLTYDPFELGLPPSVGLTNMMVTLNDFKNITSLNIDFDREPFST